MKVIRGIDHVVCSHLQGTLSQRLILNPGALEIWKRSEEARCLRYTEVISDGDSKTIAVLNENKPYGSGVMILKHECVGHVQKRLGKRMRAVKKDMIAKNKVPREKVKSLKETVKKYRAQLRKARGEVKEEKKRENAWARRGGRRGGARGGEEDIEPSTDAEREVVALEMEIELVEEEIARWREEIVTETILDADIDRMQSLYGKAIRVHPGDFEGMKKACWGVFYHYVSTD